MNAIFWMARKDLLLAIRDRAGLFFMVAFPIALGVFFGAINGGVSSKELRLTLAVVDEDQTKESTEFLDRIKRSNDSIDIQITDRENAIARVRRGLVAGAIVIPKGFGESIGLFGIGSTPVVEVAVDPSRTAEAGLLQGVLLQAAGEATFGRMRDPAQLRQLMERSRSELEKSAEMSLPMKLALRTLYGSLDGLADRLEAEQAADVEASDTNADQESESADAAGPSMQLLEIKPLPLAKRTGLIDRVRSGWDLSIPASSLWAVLGCIATFAQSLVRERTRGTLLRLQVAPLARWQLLGGKALGCWCLAVTVMGLVMTVGYGLGMRPKDPLQLVVAIACIAAGFVGVMMAMSVIGKTEDAVAGAGWGVNVIMAMLGGGMVPLAFLPGWMQPLSHFSPVKWGVLSLEGAVWREFSWAEALVPWSILLAIGVVGFAFGVWRMGRLERAA